MFDLFENWTLPRVLPIGAVLFNLLFILMSISIEAYCFNRRLKFDRNCYQSFFQRHWLDSVFYHRASAATTVKVRIN